MRRDPDLRQGDSLGQQKRPEKYPTFLNYYEPLELLECNFCTAVGWFTDIVWGVNHQLILTAVVNAQ